MSNSTHHASTFGHADRGGSFYFKGEIMNLKPALTIDEQISLLKQRGMDISNDALAEEFLRNNNYYRMNIYFHKLMDQPNHFPIHTNFERIINIYKNDIFLRQCCLTILEPIEITIKTNIAYYLGLKYGSECFYDNNLCQNHQEIIGILNREINHHQNDPVVLHHQANYAGKYPIWVIVEFLSFNSISKYYSNLPGKDKKDISQRTFGINDSFLQSWLHSLGVLRNICAHYGYLYERKYSLKPRVFKEFQQYSNDNLFALFLIMKTLMPSVNWENTVSTLQSMEHESNNFDLFHYGFPPYWYSILR